MLKPAGLVRHEAAAMRQADFQSRVALQHAAEHQTRGRDRRIERKPDEVLHVIRAKPLTEDTAMRMDKQEGTQVFRCRPERREHGVVEIAAVDVCADHGAAQAKLCHRTAQLVGRLLRRL